jgi:hypothetical protein
VLYLQGVQLALKSVCPTVLDLNEVDVTLKYAEHFGWVLFGEGRSADGWRCC